MAGMRSHQQRSLHGLGLRFPTCEMGITTPTGASSASSPDKGLWTHPLPLVRPCQALGQPWGTTEKVAPLCHQHRTSIFRPLVLGRWLLLESKPGRSSAPRGQAPDVHIWQPASGPGESRRICGPLKKRQMYFDKAATASAAS